MGQRTIGMGVECGLFTEQTLQKYIQTLAHIVDNVDIVDIVDIVDMEEIEWPGQRTSGMQTTPLNRGGLLLASLLDNHPYTANDLHPS